MVRRNLGLALILLLFLLTACQSEEPPKPVSSPPNMKASGSETEILNRFQEMSVSGSEPHELKAYIDEHIENLTPLEAEVMVDGLIDVVHRYEEPYGRAFQDLGYDERVVSSDALDENGRITYDSLGPGFVEGFLHKTIDTFYQLRWEEQDLVLVTDFRVFKVYTPYVTPYMKDYIEIMSQERANPSAVEGLLSVDRESLWKRIRSTEVFLQTHPGKRRSDEIRSLYESYGRLFLYGATSAEIHSGVVTDEQRGFYRRLSQQQLDSALASYLEGYLAVIDESDGQVTGDVISYAEEMIDRILLQE